MKRAAFIAVLLSLATACAALFHKPRPDLELSMEDRPWRVRCGWVLPSAGEPDVRPGPRADGWAWAMDSDQRRLIVTGRLEEGFFRVEGVRASSDEDDRDVIAVPATAREVRRACNVALDRAIEGEHPRLYAVMATRDGEGIDVPMFFPDDPAQPRPVSRVVVFGDSLSDTGNLKRRLLVFPNSPYWLGRFANGPNWTEYLADRTGMAVQNHAYGGASAVKHEDVPTENIIAAIQQGAQFFLTGSLEGQVRDYLERDLASGPVQQPSEVVYVIWGGANDYISKEPFTGDIRTLLDTPEGEAGYKRIVEEAVAALAEDVRRLFAAGGRQFVVINLPNLGKTPIVVRNESYVPSRRPKDDDARRLQLAKKLGELTTYHNQQLARAVATLRRELPDSRLLEVDAAKLVDLVLEERAPDSKLLEGHAGELVDLVLEERAPDSNLLEGFDQVLKGRGPDSSRERFDYGFSLQPLAKELGDGRTRSLFQQRCYDGGYLGTLDASKVCASSGSAMFWDLVHPTSYTHCWVAYFVQRELARGGLATAPGSLAEQRAYCIARNQPSD